MSSPIENSQWVYVVVQDPGGNPQLLGQNDKKAAAAFIPAFLKKDAAQACLPLMAKDDAQTYEVEAMRFDAVKDYGGQNGFAVYILEEDGTLIEKVAPSG